MEYDASNERLGMGNVAGKSRSRKRRRRKKKKSSGEIKRRAY